MGGYNVTILNYKDTQKDQNTPKDTFVSKIFINMGFGRRGEMRREHEATG